MGSQRSHARLRAVTLRDGRDATWSGKSSEPTRRRAPRSTRRASRSVRTFTYQAWSASIRRPASWLVRPFRSRPAKPLPTVRPSSKRSRQARRRRRGRCPAHESRRLHGHERGLGRCVRRRSTRPLRRQTRCRASRRTCLDSDDGDRRSLGLGETDNTHIRDQSSLALPDLRSGRNRFARPPPDRSALAAPRAEQRRDQGPSLARNASSNSDRADCSKAIGEQHM